LLQGSILVVEDEPDHAVLTVRTLKRVGVANLAVVVSDGVEALTALFGSAAPGQETPGPLPALVLLDLKLPRVGGLEVLRRIRACEHTQQVPVVILSSSDEQRDQAQGYRSGADRYLRKPMDPDQFLEVSRQLRLRLVFR
jgi:two-component system, response regulator